MPRFQVVISAGTRTWFEVEAAGRDDARDRAVSDGLEVDSRVDTEQVISVEELP
jgi:hypothetical protein